MATVAWMDRRHTRRDRCSAVFLNKKVSSDYHGFFSPGNIKLVE